MIYLFSLSKNPTLKYGFNEAFILWMGLLYIQTVNRFNIKIWWYTIDNRHKYVK